VWALLGIVILLPRITADPGLGLWQAVPKLRYAMGGLRALIAIPPFCALLGFLTPMLVDRWSAGDPDRAGRAYAVNVLGCILGPLLSGFLLLRFFNGRWVLFLFSVPWFIVSFNPGWWMGAEAQKTGAAWKFRPSCAMAVLGVILVFSRVVTRPGQRILSLTIAEKRPDPDGTPSLSSTSQKSGPIRKSLT
jgi:hypothetical protein